MFAPWELYFRIFHSAEAPRKPAEASKSSGGSRRKQHGARTTISAIKTFALIQGSKVLLWQIVKSSADFAKVMIARITRVDVQLGPTKTIAPKVVMSLG